MQKLVRKKLVNQLDYDTAGEIGVCEACIGGKQCKNSFKLSETVMSALLELVHSDVGLKSIGGAEYFLTLLDDKTHYTWVYPLKSKDQVFEHFKEWQAEVENFTGTKVKTLRTDNGGKFTSNAFQAHLKAYDTQDPRAEWSSRASQSYTGGNDESNALGCKAASG